ncbi:hypothetical protein [Desulfopila inferna]|uniref:hypothetical protein n=1 Tax=Desulfopila inferna TaxID=468528 RepID=UPI001F06FBF8|nr:hypothetical protein [Desulfopila inferna]
MRQPLVEPLENCREASQIFTDIADKPGIIPEIPEDVLQAARGNRLHFGAKLMEWAAKEPAIRSKMTFILALCTMQGGNGIKSEQPRLGSEFHSCQ